jgi:hypothetical protein
MSTLRYLPKLPNGVAGGEGGICLSGVALLVPAPVSVHLFLADVATPEQKINFD